MAFMVFQMFPGAFQDVSRGIRGLHVSILRVYLTLQEVTGGLIRKFHVVFGGFQKRCR